MEEHDKPSQSSKALSRREFVAAGGAALAGLGLAATPFVRAQKPDQTPPQNDILFKVLVDKDGYYELPPLPYAYDALAPYIDVETMRIHHDILFKGYKDNLNKAMRKLAEFRDEGEYPQIAYWENQLAYNGGGYNLHNVFFNNMAPHGTTKASDFLKNALSNDFGSFDAFKEQFSTASLKVQASGWGLLGWQPFGQKLVILQVEKHMNFTQWGIIPILACDVWEHAYFLTYQNRRQDYIHNWWQVVNWDNVATRLEQAQKIGSK